MTLALVLAACGSTSATTTPAVSTGIPATDAPATTIEIVPNAVDANRVFFLQDSGGNRVRHGPFLISVYRDLAGATPLDVVEALINGPTEIEADAGISSAIPEVTVRSVTIADGIATVDLDPLFEAGGGSLMMQSRLAQLTFTLTAIEGVDGVLLLLGGSQIGTFSGEGIIIDGPLGRDGFEDLLPGILVETPAWGAPVAHDFTMQGTAAVFEAAFSFDITHEDGTPVLDEQLGQTDNGMGFGSFATEISLASDINGPVILRVWEYSAEDGSIQVERTIPLQVEG